MAEYIALGVQSATCCVLAGYQPPFEISAFAIAGMSSEQNQKDGSNVAPGLSARTTRNQGAELAGREHEGY